MVRLLLIFRSVSWGPFDRELGVVLRTNDVVKLRLTSGLATARRAAVTAVRWRNMAASIELNVEGYDLA